MGATRVSEPEMKFIFFVLFFLGGLASTAKSEAVLPAYLVGLVLAGVFLRDKTLVHRMRSIAFAVFTPFYFNRGRLACVAAGSVDGAWASSWFCWRSRWSPNSSACGRCRGTFFMRAREANYTTLLMSTGLTFGTISALFGLQIKLLTKSSIRSWSRSSS